MALSSRKYIITLLVITIILLIIKFFTMIISLQDDPAKFLVFQVTPSFDNKVLLDSFDNSKHMIILSDENGIVGEGTYNFITRYLWWLTVLFTVFVLYQVRKDR